MERTQGAESGGDAPRVEFALTIWIIPLLSGVLMAMGWSLMERYRQDLTAMNADLAVALVAAVAGVLLAAWWFGGMLMLACAAGARRFQWHRVERFATRLTPRLMVRTVGAVVGIHLVTVSAAHATEPVNPFWPDSASGVNQVEERDPAASTDTPPGQPSAQAPGAAPEAGDEPAQPNAAHPGPQTPAQTPGHPGLPGLPHLPAASTDPEASDARDLTASRSESGAVPAQHRVTDSILTVVRGDTLWDITAEFLGPQATPAQIAAQTATWLEHNDLQNGGDLIRPGDQLHVPPQLLEKVSIPLPTEGASS